jgi:hypothetical protein
MMVSCARGVTKWINTEIKKLYGFSDTRDLWIKSLISGSENSPTKGNKGCFVGERKVTKGDNKKI